MTTNLWLKITTPYLPVQDGLTVEFWPTDAFLRSPVGNARAYPGAGSPTATATTSGGLVELTGLTDTGYASIIDSNGKPWFMAVAASAFGNTSATPRRWGINPAPSAVQSTIVFTPFVRVYLIGNTAITTGTLVPFDSTSDENSTTMTLDLATNAINAPADAYYQTLAHIDFKAQGTGKFTSGDLLVVSFFADSTLVSSTTVAPPTGATTSSVEHNDTHVGGHSYTWTATLTTVAGSTVDVLAGSYATVCAIPNVVLG